ncbi:fibronectin type III domain-containing protein [Marivirga harenae]|uniref:fibronectin type III domain-containing protein n=1 Tax=Marivirga harenae TaxID=2010992 RepID=UPI0026E08349|nr:hypothetical protein [Marivirga harenae]WKV12568.1 hypothetical protein Q3Y49_01805 [Marivirga harenae]
MSFQVVLTLLISTLVLLNPTTSYSQSAANPVQVTSNLIPPYSLYLSDYSDANQNKWNIQLSLRDFTQTNYQAKLRITIEGAGIRLRTRRGFSPGPIRLDPGMPYQVDATDLSQYLNIQNMEVSGINRSQLASTQKLPEGFYQFKIEVLDYNRSNRVSNIGTSMAWLVLNDPPLLNLPFEEKIRLQDPQQLQFQWTPRHTSSPNSAFETEYVFKLWEIWPEGRNPNEVARTTRPLLETTVITTSYFYGLNDAILIPGRSYAWQVQALNLNGRDLFKNQGKSEVKSFQYGDACQPITNLGAEAMGTDRIRIRWQGEWNHNRYIAQIRKTGEEKWFNYGTNLETQVVYDLQADTEYEIKVIPSCGAIEGDTENILTLKTLQQEIQDIDCGAEPNRPEITNQEPIDQLKIGDRITAAGFTVILTELNQLGDSYTGRGLIEVPLFNGARVEAVLNSITINTDKQLINGNIESVYNPTGPFIIGLDQGDPELSEEGTGDQEEGEEDSFDELPEPDIKIEDEIADVIVDEDTGVITIIDSGGNETDIDPETADENEDGDIVIEDDVGNIWVVGDDGEVSGPYNDNPSNPDALPEDATIDYFVQFKASPQQLYGFDSKQYETLAGNYTQTTLNGEAYWMAWKSISMGSSDPVLAEATGTDEFPEAVGFKNLSTNLGFAPGEEVNEKSVRVQTSTEDEEVTAFVLQERTNAEGETEEEQVPVGKLKVKQYDLISNKVVIVPVNDAEVPVASSLQQELNQIYGQAVASWDLNIAEPYEVSSDVLENLNEGESGWLASFPQNMRQFNRDYKRSVEFDNDAYYLFVINEEVADIAGFMPLKRQYGYIYSNNTNNLSKTIAHELGHGAFRLYHTFSDEGYVAAKNATNNLMDYKDEGTDLYKHQWDLVHDPEAMVSWLNEDEEGEMAIETNSQKVLDLVNLLRQSNRDSINDLNITSFIENYYSYKGNIRIGENDPFKIIVEHWYYSGDHIIDPMIEYAYLSSEDANQAILEFDGRIGNDNIKPMLRLRVKQSAYPQLSRYIFGDDTLRVKMSVDLVAENLKNTLSSFSIDNDSVSGFIIEREAGTLSQERTRGSEKRIPGETYLFEENNCETNRLNCLNEFTIITTTEKSGTRTGILIHSGTNYTDITGCLIPVGTNYTSSYINFDIGGEIQPITIYESNGTSVNTLNSINEYISRRNSYAENNDLIIKMEIEINR